MTHTPLQIDNLGADPAIGWSVHRPTTEFPLPDFAATPGRPLAAGEKLTGTLVRSATSDTEWLRTPAGTFVSLIAIHRIHPANHPVNGAIPLGTERVNRWWGLLPGYVPNDLALIPDERTTQEPGRQFHLRAPAQASLLRLMEAARAEGLDIRVCSAFRAWDFQKRLFDEANTDSGPAQRYSAPPGHSEHQLGTAADLCEGACEHAIEQTFAQTPEYAWLAIHGNRHGWFQSYTPTNTAQTGYICEPWHWRYMGE